MNTSESTPLTRPDVILDQPIKRGDQLITTVTLRRPLAGDLRGVSLIKVLEMDVQSVMTLVPRLSTPTLTSQEVQGMDPADLLSVSVVLAGFFVPIRLMDTVIVT